MRKPFNTGIAFAFNSRRSGISGVYLSHFDSGLRDLIEKRIKREKMATPDERALLAKYGRDIWRITEW